MTTVPFHDSFVLASHGRRVAAAVLDAVSSAAIVTVGGAAG